MSRSNLVTISLLCGYAAGAMVTAMIVVMGRAQCTCAEEHELEPELLEPLEEEG